MTRATQAKTGGDGEAIGAHLPRRAVPRASEIEQRIQQAEASLRAAGFTISLDGRIPSAAAAALIGIAPGTLRNWRCAGIGPPYGLLRSRAWYVLRTVVEWIRRESERADA
jgi:hypothetical protein